MPAFFQNLNHHRSHPVLAALLLAILAGIWTEPPAANGQTPSVASQPVVLEDVRMPVEASYLRQLSYTLAILLISALLLLLFIIGSYLLIRFGRAIMHKPVGGKPTPYVDAWSQYRLTDEEIEDATRETDGPDRNAP